MDLDEEGRTVLGFWGLRRREWGGKWRKKRKEKEKEKERGKKMVYMKSSEHEIES